MNEYSIYLSIGYIHRNWTGLAIIASSAKCTGKCSIISMKVWGKIFSRWQSVRTTRSWILCKSSFEFILEHIVLKKLLNSIEHQQHSWALLYVQQSKVFSAWKYDYHGSLNPIMFSFLIAPDEINSMHIHQEVLDS